MPVCAQRQIEGHGNKMRGGVREKPLTGGQKMEFCLRPARLGEKEIEGSTVHCMGNAGEGENEETIR